MIWLHLTSDQCCSSAFISSTKWICQNCLNLFLILFKTSLEFICNKLFDAVYKFSTIYCFNVDLLMLLMSLVNWIWCWVKLLRLRQWLRHNRSRIKMYSTVQTVHMYTTCVHNLTAFYCNTWSVCFHSINIYLRKHNESSFQPDTFIIKDEDNESMCTTDLTQHPLVVLWSQQFTIKQVGFWVNTLNSFGHSFS